MPRGVTLMLAISCIPCEKRAGDVVSRGRLARRAVGDRAGDVLREASVMSRNNRVP